MQQSSTPAHLTNHAPTLCNCCLRHLAGRADPHVIPAVPTFIHSDVDNEMTLLIPYEKVLDRLTRDSSSSLFTCLDMPSSKLNGFPTSWDGFVDGFPKAWNGFIAATPRSPPLLFAIKMTIARIYGRQVCSDFENVSGRHVFFLFEGDCRIQLTPRIRISTRTVRGKRS